MNYINLETNIICECNEKLIKFNDYELNSFSYDKPLKYNMIKGHIFNIIFLY